MTLAREWVQALRRTANESLPPAVARAAALHFTDALGVGLAASASRSGAGWRGTGGGTGSCSNIQKLVAIETRTAQGDEQLAGGNASRIGRHGSELPILAVQLAAAVARKFTQAAHQAASAYTARTTCWSLKMRRSVPIS